MDTHVSSPALGSPVKYILVFYAEKAMFTSYLSKRPHGLKKVLQCVATRVYAKQCTFYFFVCVLLFKKIFDEMHAHFHVFIFALVYFDIALCSTLLTAHSKG